jgi:hypothetical protein
VSGTLASAPIELELSLSIATNGSSKVFWVNLLADTPKVSSGTTAYRSEGKTKIEAGKLVARDDAICRQP